MNKVIVLAGLLSLIFLSSSFRYDSKVGEEQTQKILQLALELEGFQEFIVEQIPAPLTIATNNLISDEIQLSFKGQAVQLIEGTQKMQHVLEIVSMKIKDKKAMILFYYGGHEIKIKLKRDQSKWNSSSVFIRGNGYFHYTF